MQPSGSSNGPRGLVEPDLAQAFQELARGEGAATALEHHLDALEKKIDEMLAQAEADDKARPSEPSPTTAPSSGDGKSPT